MLEIINCMKKISVAIPFYNASKFIEDAIRIPLFDERVDEIIINDDCSSEEEFKNLLKIIDDLKNNKPISYDINQNFINANHKNFVHINNEMTSKNVKEFVNKIKIYKNTNNVGAFKNKYLAIKNCKNNWVYLLDSDNFLVDNSISAIFNISNLKENICYCPNVLIMERSNQAWRPWDDWNHRRFGYEPLFIKELKNLFDLENVYKEKYSSCVGVNGFLNTGNFFVNKNTYIKSLQPYVEIEKPIAADVIAFSYFWLKNGNGFQVLKDLYYYHRSRTDSYWSTNSNTSSNIALFYENQIQQL